MSVLKTTMEWISVKNRFPELGKQVLVYGKTENHPCKNEHMVQSSFYRMSNCNVIKCYEDSMYWKATHWMPLPNTPN